MDENVAFMSFEELAMSRWEHCKEQTSNWRTVARDDYAFVSGDQWTESDKMFLEQEKRPAITFNYSEKMIDAVVGAEISNRQEVRYFPREMSDTMSAEIKTEVARWVRDQCGAEDEETDALKDMLICGMGWTETSMDYEEDPDGMVVVNRRDPLEMYWDKASIKPGMTDSRYLFHAFWADIRDVKKKWPDALMFTDMTDGRGSGHIDVRHRYDDDNEDDLERHKDQVRILHYQCVEHEPFYRVQGPDGQTKNLDQEEFGQLKNVIDEQGWDYIKQTRRVYWQAFFAGDQLLEKRLSPCQVGFTFKCITGKRDRNQADWYGLTRVMKDPQRWANKWLSQILHIINTNAKGGLIAEKGAFLDPRKAEQEWAEPDSITMLNEGGISKIMPKQPGAYPSGIDRLMEFALSSLPMVTGINLEALGLANREQAGVLEAQRKQAAYGLLSPLFDSLRRYRKEQGKILLYFINEFISDGRVVRIVGKDGAQQWVPLQRDADSITYDVIVDQSPTAPDVKERTWESLMQLIPSLMKANIPIPPDLLDYTPLPTTLIQKWKEFASKQQINPQQVQQMQQQMQQLSQENQKLKADQQQEMMQLQLDAQRMQQEMQLKLRAQAQEFALKRAEMEAELAIKQQAQQADTSMNQIKTQNDMHIKRIGALNEARIRSLKEGLDMEENGGLIMPIDMQPIADVMGEIVKTQSDMAERMDKTNSAIVDAIQTLEDTMSKPKVIVKDKNGKPIGIKPVED